MKKSGGLKTISFQDCKPNLSQTWLVANLIAEQGLTFLYGPPGSGKTFFALDLALSIAAGLPVAGKDVLRGLVLYIAAEAGLSIQHRLQAWKIKHPTIDKLPFFVVLPTFDAGADADSLIQKARELEVLTGEELRLIVIDTFSRSIGGRDENTSHDMGLIIQRFDQIRAETGAHLMAVHHVGKDHARGMRGHSLLLGAVDTAISVWDEGGQRKVRVEKQRDLPTGDEIAFTLEPVVIGQDDDGKDVVSCVIKREGAFTVPPPSPPKLSRNDLKVLVATYECQEAPDQLITFDRLTAALKESESRPAQLIRRHVPNLVRFDLVTRELIGVTLTAAGLRAAQDAQHAQRQTCANGAATQGAHLLRGL